jgi:predicted RNA-binding Zn ribbon-like protein
VQPLEELTFVGGHPALDFVNTAEERGHPEAGDVLHASTDLRRWGQRYGLLSVDARVDRAELRRALEAREVLYVLFDAIAEGRRPPRPELERLGALGAAAYRAGTLEEAPSGKVTWRWPNTELSTVRHVAVAGALDLLRDDRIRRLKQCPGEHCGWFFLDTTRRGNRRWCSMSECGQEVKIARRRERRRRPAA